MTALEDLFVLTSNQRRLRSSRKARMVRSSPSRKTSILASISSCETAFPVVPDFEVSLVDDPSGKSHLSILGSSTLGLVTTLVGSCRGDGTFAMASTSSSNSPSIQCLTIENPSLVRKRADRAGDFVSSKSYTLDSVWKSHKLVSLNSTRGSIPTHLGS